MAEESDDVPNPGADEEIVTPGGDEGGDQGEQQEPEEIQALAAEMGWKPKAEWKGDPTTWSPARDYLKTAVNANKSLKSDVKRLSQSVERISATTAKMTDRAIADARAKWEDEHARAVDDGDREGARKAARELEKLEQQPAADLPEEAQAFAEKHSSWFNKDREATTYAINRADHYAKQGLSPARQLAKVEKDMRETFPELFPEEVAKPQQKAPPSLGAPARTARPAAREKGYATLPPEARKACDAYVERNGNRFANQTPDQVRAQWAKEFYADSEA